MKRMLAATVLAGGLLTSGNISAAVFESEFGGYMRTRFVSVNDLDGIPRDSSSWLDARLHLDYTVRIGQYLAFVTAEELDSAWRSYDDQPVDDVDVEVKKLYIAADYADFSLIAGEQDFLLAHSFLMDDNAPGVRISYEHGAVEIPFIWARLDDDTLPVYADGADLFSVAPSFRLGHGVVLQPALVYEMQDDTDTELFWASLDIDARLRTIACWATVIYNFGETEDNDVSSWLLAASSETGTVHGQVFYASGDADGESDGRLEAFQNTGLMSYYWAEIMGLGILDSNASAMVQGPADAPSDILAANLGFTIRRFDDRLRYGFDLWYAEYAEKNDAGDDVLGTEIDITATYALTENVQLDFVAAYLFAGAAYGDEDPVEFGVRFLFSF